MTSIQRYTPDMAPQWDAFVARSRNATFLLSRPYMDYHADRFTDHSLVFRDDAGKILSLLPANADGDTILSHGGLTYGSLVLAPETSAVDVLAWMEQLKEYLRNNSFKQLVYKPVPHIYHKRPSDDDLYALFRVGATLNARNLASAIDLRQPLESSRLGKRAAKRMRRFAISVEPCHDPANFWQIIVDDRRERHNTTPVHTLEEIQLLARRCPDNIRCFVAKAQGEIVAGAVIFADNGVLHLQYAAANSTGKEIHAVDAIYHSLIFNLLPGFNYFDFGTSNERSGLYLNAGMVAHKEEFGARSVAYDTYTINL
ncbi:MAG: GNAT family N-acetyltransferase [Bacteroidales bacterium]|nr:GNAT family N-acetyltransferase [Bacteroidales bacterium]